MKTQIEIQPADYRKLSDEELVYRFAHRHEQVAINYLFERYGHLVYGICMTYTRNASHAKHTTENIFVKLTTDLIKFNIPVFKQWLFKYVNAYCQLEINNNLQVADIKAMDNSVFDKDVRIESEREENKLDELMSDLSKEQKECLELFYNGNANHAEIVKKTGKKLKDVKSIIHEGRQYLITKMEAYKYERK